MTSLLNLLDRFENAAGVYERSDDPADRDELHAARRAIIEAFEEARRADIVPATITDKDGNKRDAFVDRARGIVLEPAPTIVEAELVKALTKCQSALSMLITPTNEITSGIGIQSAWAICVEAETAARAALNPSLEQE